MAESPVAGRWPRLQPDVQRAVEQLRRHPGRTVQWRLRIEGEPVLLCRARVDQMAEGEPLGYLLELTPAPDEGAHPGAAGGAWDEVVDNVAQGLWDWDLESGTVRRSIGFEALLGLTPLERDDDVEDMLARVHRFDLARLRYELNQLIAGQSERFVSEHRVQHSDGRWRWVQDRGEAIAWDLDGRPARIVGAMTDITADKHLQARLGESEFLLDEAQRLAGIGSWAWDPIHGGLWCSDAMRRIAGLTGEEDVPSLEGLGALFTERSHARLSEALARALADNQAFDIELDLCRPDGQLRRVVMRGGRVHDSAHFKARLAGIALDVTDTRRAESQARWQRNLLERMAVLGRIGGFELDLDSYALQLTDEACRIHGLAKGTPLTFDGLLMQYEPASQQAMRNAIAQTEATGRADEFVASLRTPDGQRVWVQCRTELREGDGRGRRLTGLLRDITSERDADERVRHMSHFDSLTGLPNRFLFRQRAMEAVQAARPGVDTLALLFIDLDRFKLVNDSLGHDLGDELLFEVAERIRACVHSDDVLARHGGDEFMLLLRGLRSADAAGAVARRIVDAVGRPLELGDTEVRVGCSIGIAVLDERNASLEALMRAADAAMYAAKEAGRNTFQFCTETFFERAQRRVRIETDLRHALGRGEFEMCYQPTLRLSDERVVGIEALMRWPSADGERRSPGEFIPIAEESGEIVRIGEWVLEEACRDARRWREQGIDFERVAVNVSAVQMRDPRFAARVIEICKDTGWPTERLELEITETTLMRDNDILRRGFALFEANGVRLAVDDFGTGFSNLNYLHRFPVSHLKIDRGFTLAMIEDPAVSELTNAIIGLGHALGLRVIAEGVETPEMAEALRRQGCDEVQGYFYSRPLSAEALGVWMLARQ